MPTTKPKDEPLSVTAKIKDKMLYASSKDALRKKLVGVHLEVQATDMDEVEYDEIYQKVSAGGTK